MAFLSLIFVILEYLSDFADLNLKSRLLCSFQDGVVSICIEELVLSVSNLVSLDLKFHISSHPFLAMRSSGWSIR